MRRSSAEPPSTCTAVPSDHFEFSDQASAPRPSTTAPADPFRSVTTTGAPRNITVSVELRSSPLCVFEESQAVREAGATQAAGQDRVGEPHLLESPGLDADQGEVPVFLRHADCDREVLRKAEGARIERGLVIDCGSTFNNPS